MSREIRNTIHQKQNRMQIQRGIPNVAELSEGVPVLRSVPGIGIVEYVRYNGQLYSSAYSVHDPIISNISNNISLLNDGTIAGESFPGTVSNSVDDTTSSVQDDLASLAAKVNEIIRVLRNSNLLGDDGKFGDTHSV
tara:strand:+ start:642 stop:1052 length:411 start_codon:yes stop_codon:yes gene_type:complete